MHGHHQADGYQAPHRGGPLPRRQLSISATRETTREGRTNERTAGDSDSDMPLAAACCACVGPLHAWCRDTHGSQHLSSSLVIPLCVASLGVSHPPPHAPTTTTAPHRHDVVAALRAERAAPDADARRRGEQHGRVLPLGRDAGGGVDADGLGGGGGHAAGHGQPAERRRERRGQRGGGPRGEPAAPPAAPAAAGLGPPPALAPRGRAHQAAATPAGDT